MTAIPAERNHLVRWAASAVVVIGLHGLGVAALLARHDPLDVGDLSFAVVIDLAPYVAESDSREDLPPGPAQQQAALPSPPEQVEPKPEKTDDKAETKIEPEEKIEVPPAPVPPVAALPPPPEAVEPPPEPIVQPTPPTDTPPAPGTTAPPRPHHASAAEIDKWKTGIVALINSHMAFPEAARARRQKGVVQVTFAFNRQGRVVASQVARTSGYALLDQAALDGLQKAQPFPPPPDGAQGDVFSFTLPLRFRLQ
jgi:protein TonB